MARNQQNFYNLLKIFYERKNKILFPDGGVSIFVTIWIFFDSFWRRKSITQLLRPGQKSKKINFTRYNKLPFLRLSVRIGKFLIFINTSFNVWGIYPDSNTDIATSMDTGLTRDRSGYISYISRSKYRHGFMFNQNVLRSACISIFFKKAKQRKKKYRYAPS